eukprot:CAMPEP_0197195232 /NCGR_PEP_ID=MMETSP1423-20130617/30688_1 /TAXON_ID=476441 /ORGANISM="Pseudo-nitzschia heimii, Strain UNC1101" /LENGTH=582 /DNA_ID=CAMNT_0042648815 /DNA_START=418 /DNA_END=2166 /DNA_ORIENTATION=+
MRQILLKTPRGNTAVIPVDHFVTKASGSAPSEAVLSSEEEPPFSHRIAPANIQSGPVVVSGGNPADEETAAIAAAIDTARIFDEEDIDRRGKEELLYHLIGASKRRDVGRKRNVRSVYNVEVEDEDDRMCLDAGTDMDIDEGSADHNVNINSSTETMVQVHHCHSDRSASSACSQSFSEEQKVAARFDDIDINSDEHYYRTGNFKKSRRRLSSDAGVRSSTIVRNTRRHRSGPFQSPSEQQKGSASSCTTPPLMVAFYHQGRKVSLDRIWYWITGSRTDPGTDDAGSNPGARASSASAPQWPLYLTLSTSVRLLGGIDRQNRVGSKFGGGGVSSSQNAERERKERLKQLALESIDLAKDPYLMRNHLGTYECKLCLTLHTNEANYLAHTQGKKHQAGLAKRAHMEKLKAEREEQLNDRNIGLKRPPPGSQYEPQPARKILKIGRPAYQVFKSRDTATNQRCLTFELTYRDIKEDLRPRHRFMSAFEQRVDLPRDKRYQYVLFAAEPYETIAFKIPNEPLDRTQGRLITHWDADDKKFTVTLYFADDSSSSSSSGDGNNKDALGLTMETEESAVCTFAPALSS